MARYIDAGEFIDRVLQYSRQSTKTIGQALADTPTADVAEVKHGRWKTTDAFPHWQYCDQCYKRIVPNADWIKEYNIPTNYCPNCGADMRERRDDG